MFGSFSNGFKTGTSDLDVVFVGSAGTDTSLRELLAKFATIVPSFGFENITRILQANVPLVKFTDRRSQTEVDFCINNELGIRNSLLLNSYCKYDERILRCGRLVKEWAKKHELVGTADGCLNSYAYMLLVIFFLQSISPPVAPNLQSLSTDSRPIVDHKWGCEDCWETKFLEDVSLVPASQNTMDVSELLVRFFHFYSCVFDWERHAICMRLNAPGVVVDKFSLATPTNEEQWYLEDPFDLKHNLAGKCTRAGKKRILEEMRGALQIIGATGKWSHVCPYEKEDHYFLKCRVSPSLTPQALLEEFEEYDLVKLHFPKLETGMRSAQAFLEFNYARARRAAHTKNECYVADCHLQLHYSSQHGLAEAMGMTQFSTYEMASYKMQRQVLAARLLGPPSAAAPLQQATSHWQMQQISTTQLQHQASVETQMTAAPHGPGRDFAQPVMGHTGMTQHSYMQQMQAQQMQMQISQSQQMQMQMQQMPMMGMHPHAQMTPTAHLHDFSEYAVRDYPWQRLQQEAAAISTKKKEKETAAAKEALVLKEKAVARQASTKNTAQATWPGDAGPTFFLKAEVSSDIPSNMTFLSASQQHTVRGLQTFLKNFPNATPEHLSSEVTVQLNFKEELDRPLPGKPKAALLSPEHLQKVRLFQDWVHRGVGCGGAAEGGAGEKWNGESVEASL